MKKYVYPLLAVLAVASAGIGGSALFDSVIIPAAADDDVASLPPAKQVAMGVAPEDVTCQGERMLMLRTNGDPICVNPESSERFVSMGIATVVEPEPDDEEALMDKGFDVDTSKLVVSMTRLSDTFDAKMEAVMMITEDAIAMYEEDHRGALDAITAGAATYDAMSPYPFVVDFETLEVLAHGFDPERVGNDATPIIDAGKQSADEMKQALEDDGETWIMYTTTNPANGKEQIKKSYVKLHESYVFGSGFYLSDLEAEMIVARWVGNSAADLYDEQGTGAFEMITSGDLNHGGVTVYAFATDLDTKKVVAHGADESRIGDPSSIIAGNANKMIDQILAESEANGGTWVTYEFTNFDTGAEGLKVSWLTVRDDYLLGAGFYPDESMAGKVHAIMSTDMALAMYAAGGQDSFDEITALNVEENWYPFVFGYEDMIEYADGSTLDRSGVQIWESYEHNASLYGIRDALEAGQGAFTTYVFLNPETGEPQSKKSWYVLHDGYIFGAGVYLDGKYADKAAAKWSATKALEMYRDNGVEAFESINAMKTTDETYPFVFDSKFMVVANGADTQYVGTNVFDLITPDKDAAQIMKELESSKTGTTWIKYQFVHPETGEADAPKVSILRMHDDYIFGAGYYPDEMPASVVSMTRLSDTFDAKMEAVMMITEDAIAMYEEDHRGALDAITAGAATYDAMSPYPFVVDFETLEVLAHGFDPERVGNDATPIIDAGKQSADEMRQALEDDGETWIMYTTTNPANGKEQIKKSYVKLHESYVFGSGFYLSDLEAEMIVARWVGNSAADLYDEQGTGAFEMITSGDLNHGGVTVYAFAADLDTKKLVAHGADESRIGDPSSIIAGNANKMIDQILAESEANGGTWVTYEFTNFDTGAEGLKVSWLTVRDDYLLGAGFYPDESMAGKVHAIMSTDMALAMYAAGGQDSFDEITALNVEENWYPFVFGYEDMIEYADGSTLDRSGVQIWESYEHNASLYGIRDALEAGQGAFTTYVFLNPETGEPQSKKSWYVLHDGYIFGAGVYLDGKYADKAAAKWSATKALEMYDEDGIGAFEAISSMASTDETYPFVLDSEFDIVAHGADKSLVGSNLFNIVDLDMTAEETTAALEGAKMSTIWIEYTFAHPETGEDAPKVSILRMHGDGYIFGAGYYAEMPYVISKVEFTDSEREWLTAHPEIRVSYDANWPPYEYIDESGMLAGASGAMADAFAHATGSEFAKAASIKTWGDALDAMRNGDADVMLMVENTAERDMYMDFTDTWYVLPIDIVVRSEHAGMITAENLGQYKVVTVTGYAVETWLDENMPDLNYTSVSTAAEALGMLDDGTADAYLDPWESASRVAAGLGIEGLESAGDLGDSYELSVAYTEGDATLGSILQKLLDAIPQDDQLMIIETAISAAGH